MEIDRGFYKARRSRAAEELLKDPKAYVLLSLIALRAWRTNEISVHGLQIGEALIGDHKSCGLTEKEYRCAKDRLKRGGFATFRGTNKGTIAKLINSSVFDINPEEEGEQKGEPRANQGRTRGEQGATNKKDKIDKSEKKDKSGTASHPSPQNGDAQLVPEKPVKSPMPPKLIEFVRIGKRAFQTDHKE